MFQGGIKLNDFKALSKGEQIEDFPAPAKAIIPLSQHTGLPAKASVKKGDEVLKGQVIGEPAGFISSFIHSSISGKVIGIEDKMLPGGRTTPSVIIENDGKETTVESITNDWKTLQPDEIISIVQKAGIVGMGGAAFPTFVKLTIPAGKKADCVLLNGCECEPFLTADYRVMKEDTEKIIEGLLIICKALSVKRAYIGIESNKKDILSSIKKSISGLSDITVSIKVLPERYPQGSEKHLINSITGREVPSECLPVDIGCVVFNVQTCLAIRDAVCKGVPLTERVLTVTGLVNSPGNLRVRIGTPISTILDYCGAELKAGSKIIIGGPMMGVNILFSDIPVTKGTTGIILLPEEIQNRDSIHPCIRCGKCIETCPMRLIPSELSRYAELKNWEKCEQYNVVDCIECGCCSYVCPAKRPMVDLLKWAKAEIRKNNG